MDYYFQGIWRMDWGLGNPNKTAALIAMLMIAIWALPLIRRWLFWVALPAFVALGVCLMHTMSRGGTLAVFAGLGVVLWQVRRAAWPWPRGKVLAGGVAVMAIFAGAVALQTTSRFAQGPQDRSIASRLQIWKHTPRMMVDAPAGWGWQRSDVAYSQWYQPLAQHERYRTLINSHLTWMVEIGWPQRALYVLGWAAIFVLCWPPGAWQRRAKTQRCEVAAEASNEAESEGRSEVHKGAVDDASDEEKAAACKAGKPIKSSTAGEAGKVGEPHETYTIATGLAARAGFGIAFGLWLAFFVASIFSAVAEEPRLWVLPLLGLLMVLVVRIGRWTWPGARAWASGAGLAGVVLASIYALGVMSPASGLRTEKNGGIVFDANANEEVAVASEAAIPAPVQPPQQKLAAPPATTASTSTAAPFTASALASSAPSTAATPATPTLWILTPDKSTAVSVYYPRDWRNHARRAALQKERMPVVGFARRVAELPDLKGRQLAVIGSLSPAEWAALEQRLDDCEGLLLFAPDIPATSLRLPEKLKPKTGVLFGEFSMQPAAASWRGHPGYRQLEGTGDFFQNWPELVLAALEHFTKNCSQI